MTSKFKHPSTVSNHSNFINPSGIISPSTPGTPALTAIPCDFNNSSNTSNTKTNKFLKMLSNDELNDKILTLEYKNEDLHNKIIIKEQEIR